MKTVKELEKERQVTSKKNAPINAKLRRAKGISTTLKIVEHQSDGSRFFNTFIRKAIGAPLKEEADE